MSDVLTAGDVEVEDLTALEFTPDIQCDWQDCQNKAFGYLVCAACQMSREAECALHRSQSLITTVIDPEWQIKFSTSCDHSPFYIDCPFEPIS